MSANTLYYSVRTRDALAAGVGAVPFGFAHYSYALVCRKILDLIECNGWTAQELVRPEIYPSYHHAGSDHDHGGIRLADPPVHLIVKPFDELRVLKGARNIAVVFWEFDRLPVHDRLPAGHPRRSNIMHDFRHCLRLVDEVWVGCDFTRDVLRREGIPNVHTVPTPIHPAHAPWAATAPSEIEVTACGAEALRAVRGAARRPRPASGLFQRIARAKRQGGRIFVTAFNPGDSRKNPGAAMLGFQFAQRRPADLFIVKLVVDGLENTLGRCVTELLPDRFHRSQLNMSLLDCPEMLLVAGKLTEAEMLELWQAADCYICSSSAEGQNLPLLESMAHGAVPISPAITAMADYVRPENAFVLPTHQEPVQHFLADAYGMVGAMWEVVTPRDVAHAVSTASAAPDSVIAARSRAAKRFVDKHYSPAALWTIMRRRLGIPAAHAAAPDAA